MRSNVLLGYLVLSLAAVLIAGATAGVLLYRPAPPGPLDALAPCRPIVGGPTPVYVCRTGHAYALQGNVVVDLGGVAGPAPRLPRR